MSKIQLDNGLVDVATKTRLSCRFPRRVGRSLLMPQSASIEYGSVRPHFRAMCAMRFHRLRRCYVLTFRRWVAAPIAGMVFPLSQRGPQTGTDSWCGTLRVGLGVAVSLGVGTEVYGCTGLRVRPLGSRRLRRRLCSQLLAPLVSPPSLRSTPSFTGLSVSSASSSSPLLSFIPEDGARAKAPRACPPSEF